MASHLPQTWEIIETTADHFKIRAFVKAIDAAMDEGESGLVIGQCKGLLDSVCKSILVQKNIGFQENANSNELAKLVVNALGVAKGVENNRKAKEAFKRMVSSVANTVTNAVKSINELRNDFCPVAHGRANNHTPLDMHYAKYIAGYVDGTIAFIYQLWSNTEEYIEPINYELNKEFNDELDDLYEPYQLLSDTYLPSEIIFNLKPDQYRDLLAEGLDGGLDDE